MKAMTPTLYVIEFKVGPRKWEPTHEVSSSLENANSHAKKLSAFTGSEYRVRRYVRAK